MKPFDIYQNIYEDEKVLFADHGGPLRYVGDEDDGMITAFEERMPIVFMSGGILVINTNRHFTKTLNECLDIILHSIPYNKKLDIITLPLERTTDRSHILEALEKYVERYKDDTTKPPKFSFYKQLYKKRQ